MAIEKMKLIRVHGTVEHIDEFITSCCISGEFHPEDAMHYLSGSLGFVHMNDDNPYTDSIQRLEDLASIAGVTLKETFNRNEIIIDSAESYYIQDIRMNMKTMLDDRQSTSERVKEVTSSLEQFKHFSNLDVPIDELFDTEFLKMRFGSIPKDCYPKLKAYDDNENILFFEASHDDKNYWGLYVAPETKIDEVDRIFASLYFERVRIPTGEGTPKEIMDRLSTELSELTEKLTLLDKKISDYWAENSENCERIYANIHIASMAFDLRKYAAKDNNSSYYTYVGWVPEPSMKWFKNKIDKIPDTTYEAYEPSEDTHNDPPVKLKNRKLFRPFEMFVEMYGLPSYGEIDITPFVAITYTLLFGIMFADVGQGLVLAIGGYILYKLKGNKLAKIMVPCGACSTIFGLLFGSVFGYEELLDPVYKAIGLSGKPFSVMDSINSVLLFSIGIGVALVLVSMGINVFCCIKRKKFGEAIFSQNGITGMILYSVLVCAVIGFMGGIKILPTIAVAIIAVVCLIILYFKEVIIAKIDHEDDLMPEKWSDYLMQNFFEIIEYILTYFSNTVSFLRVGAFVLVHAGMMMVFSSLAGNEYSVGGIISMIFGNILVICLEGLLTGIQVLRLEFYEMFSRFYEGEGKPFNSIGIRKNRGFLFKMKNAFKTDTNENDNGSDENVVITVNK